MMKNLYSHSFLKNTKKSNLKTIFLNNKTSHNNNNFVEKSKSSNNRRKDSIFFQIVIVNPIITAILYTMMYRIFRTATRMRNKKMINLNPSILGFWKLTSKNLMRLIFRELNIGFRYLLK